MLRKLLLCLGFGLLLAANGSAAIIVSIDLDDATPGIQSTRVFGTNQTVNAGVFMELTAPSTIAIYNFSVRYDVTELAFVSRTEFPFGPLAETDFTNSVNTTTGTILRIDGSTFGQGQAAPFGPVRVANLVFTTTNPTGGTADIDITPGLFQPQDDLFFDNAFANVTTSVIFNGASITAIPEPTSLALVGFASCCAIWTGVRRFRKK